MKTIFLKLGTILIEKISVCLNVSPNKWVILLKTREVMPQLEEGFLLSMLHLTTKKKRLKYSHLSMGKGKLENNRGKAEEYIIKWKAKQRLH